jgi:putative endonuclease
MYFFVYLIVSKKNNKYTSYVGYTSNLKRRLELHNTSKGAKFTRGRLWKLIYKKKYKNKSLAMKEEYLLKKNSKLRKKIKNSYIRNVK